LDAGVVDELFGYTSREWDSDVGLQYNRARWYDPAAGRWLSQDPIGFAGGDANLYRMVGNHTTYATDPSGLADPSSFPNLLVNGKTFEFDIEPTGRRTSLDFTRSVERARLIDSSFQNAAAYGGTWHHKAFDSQTGKMTMQLVDSKLHSVNHKGGVLQYEKWVQEVLENGSYLSLNADQAKAFQTAIKSREMMINIGERLAKNGTKLSAMIVNASADVAEITLDKAGVLTKLTPALGNGGRIVKVVTKYAPGLGAVFAIYAGGKSYANGGDTSDIATAVGRDLMSADLVESGFQVVIVDAGGVFHDHVVNPGGVIAKRAGALTDREKADLIRQTNVWMKSRPSFKESVDQIYETETPESLIRNYWNWIIGKERV